MINDIFIESVRINSLRDLWSDIVIAKQKTYFYIRGINFYLTFLIFIINILSFTKHEKNIVTLCNFFVFFQ